MERRTRGGEDCLSGVAGTACLVFFLFDLLRFLVFSDKKISKFETYENLRRKYIMRHIPTFPEEINPGAGSSSPSSSSSSLTTPRSKSAELEPFLTLGFVLAGLGSLLDARSPLARSVKSGGVGFCRYHWAFADALQEF